ncbi:MAG: hypothetical protein OXD49_11240, partial [Candidatus Poribacteria bacterium]|nr:hypothetical protein [Candidatus Poribacteria bacterium]
IGIAAVLAMLAVGEGAKSIVTQEFEKFGAHYELAITSFVSPLNTVNSINFLILIPLYEK